jgi:hypothetical protein
MSDSIELETSNLNGIMVTDTPEIVSWPASIRYPQNGGKFADPIKFEIDIVVPSTDGLDERRRSSEHVIGFRNLRDRHGRSVECTPENLERMKKNIHFARAADYALAEIVRGEPVKPI